MEDIMANPDPDFVAFLKAHPAYPTTQIIDDLRASEYARLDIGGHIYLDYTGGGLYAESQLRRHAKLLSEHVFGNPHSSNPTSQAATQLVEHTRDWIEIAHQNGWNVLLDAAAFVPTNKLDLSKVKPDFVPLSFYKMFGYPTGLGALIARKNALSKLQRPWFAGGTITVASVQGGKYYFADASSAFEDGTIDYLNIPAIEIGLKHMESIGYDVIGERVQSLSGWLLENLTSMRHSNGKQLVRVYGPTTTERRGGAVTV